MAGESEISLHMDGELPARPLDVAIAALAGRQHGVVSRRQLEELGLTRNEIEGRLARGRLHRLHQGVYAVGHRIVSLRGSWMAAVLAAGPGAVLSHRDAAGVWDLRPSQRGRVEVTAPRQRKRPGFDVYCTSLVGVEVSEIYGIDVPTVARPLLVFY
jgi:predicted transcriptional regulator of viral defense system